MVHLGESWQDRTMQTPLSVVQLSRDLTDNTPKKGVFILLLI